MSDAAPQHADRAELARLAALREQANRPRWPLVVGGLAVAGGLVLMLYGYTGVSAAESRRRAEASRAGQVAALVARLERHTEAAASQGPGRFDPFPGFTVEAEQLAREAGLTPTPTLSRQRENVDRRTGLIEREYQYERVSARDLGAMLDWVARITERVPGVEITRLELTPRPSQWQMQIYFVKPELPR